MSQEEIKKQSLKVEILAKMADLMTAGFGLVAALAWNDFIKALFAKIFPEPGNNLWAMLFYALTITVLVVLVTVKLGQLLELAKKQLSEEKKHEQNGDK